MFGLIHLTVAVEIESIRSCFFFSSLHSKETSLRISRAFDPVPGGNNGKKDTMANIIVRIKRSVFITVSNEHFLPLKYGNMFIVDGRKNHAFISLSLSPHFFSHCKWYSRVCAVEIMANCWTWNLQNVFSLLPILFFFFFLYIYIYISLYGVVDSLLMLFEDFRGRPKHCNFAARAAWRPSSLSFPAPAARLNGNKRVWSVAVGSPARKSTDRRCFFLRLFWRLARCFVEISHRYGIAFYE